MEKLILSKKFLTKNNIFWFIFIVSLIKSSLFSHLGFGLLDEGESLHNAVRILDGDIPYKDFFAIFPPLDNYFFALIFNLFGKSVLAPRIVMSFIFSFSPAFLFLILLRYSNKAISMVPAILMIFLDLNVERLYFFTPVLMSIYYLKNNVFLSGLLLGLSSLVRIDIPGTYLVGFIVTLIIENFKNIKLAFTKISYLLTGYILILSIVFFWLIKNGIFSLFVKSAFVDSVIITKLHDLSVPKLLDIFPWNFNLQSLSASYQTFYFYAVLCVYVVFFILLLQFREKIKRKDYWVVGIFVSGLLSLPYVFGRTDLGHIVKGSIPVLIIAPFLVHVKSPYKILSSVFLICSVALLIFANLVQSIWWLSFNDTILTVNNYYLRVNSKSQANSTLPSAETLKAASLFLKDVDTSEKVLALPYLAGVYFLSDTNPPGKFNNLLAGFIASEESQKDFIQSIKNGNVRKIVYARDSGPKMSMNKLLEYNSTIDSYIMNNYEVIKKSSEGWLFMVKK